jgi:hypothetical protein
MAQYANDISFEYTDAFSSALDQKDTNAELGSKKDRLDPGTCQVNLENPTPSRLAHDPATRKVAERNNMRFFATGPLGTQSSP